MEKILSTYGDIPHLDHPRNQFDIDYIDVHQILVCNDIDHHTVENGNQF